MTKLVIPPRRLLLVGIVASCAGSFQQGFMLALLNPAKFVLQTFVNESHNDHYDHYMSSAEFSSLWSVLVSCVTLGSMFGALLLPAVAQKLGRRNGIVATAVFSLTFAVAEGVSKYASSWELYFIGRFMLGVSVGIAMGLQSLYLTEITPKECRGFMNTFTGLGMALAELVASVLALQVVLGSWNLWPVLHFVQIPVFLIPLVFLPRYPKSPKMLFAVGQEEQAHSAISYFYGPTTDVTQIVDEIRMELKAARMSIAQIFRNPDVRRAVIVSGVLSFGVGFSGGLVILFYASTLLKQIGMSEDVATYLNIPVVAMISASVLVAMLVMDKVGRRNLSLFGTFCLVILNITALILSVTFDHFRAAGHDVRWLGYFFLVNAIGLLLAFGVSVAPIALFIAAELAPQNARSGAQSVAVFIRNLSMFAGGAIFLPFHEKAGGYAFLLFIIPMIFVFLFLYVSLPETKGRTYPEILEAWPELPGGLWKRPPQTIEMTDMTEKALLT